MVAAAEEGVEAEEGAEEGVEGAEDDVEVISRGGGIMRGMCSVSKINFMGLGP